jgi:hypothetical protein
MSIVDDLKAEAAKLLAEAEKVEQSAVTEVKNVFHAGEKDVTADVAKVESDAKQDVAKVDTEVKAAVAEVKTDVKDEAAAVETKTAAVVAVAKAPVAQFKGKKVMGVEYATDGLTVEWKGN